MTSESTLRAAIYARISADPQGRAVGVHDQAKQCRQLAERHGWQVTGPGCGCGECVRFDVPADVYCDNDISAEGKKARPHYERLLADIRARRVDVVVAVHTDRLHRNVTELEAYIGACGEGSDGVPTYTVKGGSHDLTTSYGRMVARIFGAVARGELEHMMERQQAAKQRNRDAGIRQAGYAPFGFRHDVRDSKGRQIPGVSKGLAPVESEAELIRSGYADLLAGVSLGEIARRWNRTPLRTAARVTKSGQFGGKDWTVITVRQVLMRAANAGVIEHEVRENSRRRGQMRLAGQASWEPVVSEDTWRAARRILQDPARRMSPGPEPRYLLTGVLICGVCKGRAFRTMPNSYGRRYACRCNRRSRKAAPLDAFAEQIIIERVGRPDVVAALNTHPAVDIPALDARRTAINAELEEWARTPGITPRQLQIKNQPLLADLAEIERQISDALHGDPLAEFKDGRDPEKVWKDLPIARQRAVARMLLRIRLHRPRQMGKPEGWKKGDPYLFDYDSVEILPADA